MDLYISSHMGSLLFGQVLEKSDLCDTVIISSNGEIDCHACVISMASDRIRNLVAISPKQNGKKVLHMENVDYEAVFAVLKYIYTGNEVSNYSTKFI